MKLIAAAMIAVVSVSLVGCNQSAKSSQKSLEGREFYGNERELFWAKAVDENSSCFFVSKASFVDGKFEKIVETKVATKTPISKEKFLAELKSDTKVSLNEGSIARVKDALTTALAVAPLTMLFVNHPGIVGVPEILARVAPAMFWYGSGLFTYLSTDNAETAKKDAAQRAEALPTLTGKASQSNLESQEPRIKLSDAEADLLGRTLARLGKLAPTSDVCEKVLKTQQGE
ncbi:hypothetical protein EBR21_10315 [bacterium]|nr:hypothetical protein [bacterium]